MEITATNEKAVSVQNSLEVASTTTNKVAADDVRQLLEYIKLIE